MPQISLAETIKGKRVRIGLLTEREWQAEQRDLKIFSPAAAFPDGFPFFLGGMISVLVYFFNYKLW